MIPHAIFMNVKSLILKVPHLTDLSIAAEFGGGGTFLMSFRMDKLSYPIIWGARNPMAVVLISCTEELAAV